MPRPPAALFSRRRRPLGRLARLAAAAAIVALACGCPELKALRQQNAALRAENESWRLRWESTEGSRKEAVGAMRDQERDLQGEIDRVNGALQEQGRVAVERERELVEELRSARAESERLAGELADANKRGDELSKQLADANAATAAAESKRASEAKALGAEIEKLRGEAASLARDVERLKGEVAALAGRADDAEKERDRWRAEAKLAQDAAAKAQAAAEAAPRMLAPSFPKAKAEAAIAAIRDAIGADAIKALGLESRADDKGAALILPCDVLFEKEAVALSSKTLKPLAALGKELAKQSGEWRFAVAGHADNVPIKSLPFYNNRELSFNRAFAVTRVLAEDGGVAEAALETRALGEHAPRANNRDAKGRAANRRVEIVFLPRGAGGE